MCLLGVMNFLWFFARKFFSSQNLLRNALLHIRLETLSTLWIGMFDEVEFLSFYPTRLKFAEMELVCRLYQERWRSIKLATLWKYGLQLGSWAKFSKLVEVINLRKWRPFQYAANLSWLFRRAEWRNEHGSVRLQSGNCWWWEGNIYLTRLSSGGCPIGEELVLIMSNSRHPQTLQVSFPQFSVDFHCKIDSCSA